MTQAKIKSRRNQIRYMAIEPNISVPVECKDCGHDYDAQTETHICPDALILSIGGLLTI